MYLYISNCDIKNAVGEQ